LTLCGMLPGMRLPDWWDAQEPHWQRTAVVLSVILTGVSIVVAVALTSGSSGETGHRLATTPTVPVSTAPPSVSPSTASVTTPAVSPSPDASDSPTPIAVPSPDR